jgi:hypothetical protein
MSVAPAQTQLEPSAQGTEAPLIRPARLHLDPAFEALLDMLYPTEDENPCLMAPLIRPATLQLDPAFEALFE